MPLIKGKQLENLTVTGSKIADSTITQAKLNLSTPVSPNDAATKDYADGLLLDLSLKQSVIAKYDFAGGVSPSIPSLPTEPSTPTFSGTIHTITTELELTNALAAAVDGDIIEIPSSTTITLTSSKTINKSVELRGQDKTTSVITASFAVSANSGVLIISGTKSGGAQNNDVYLHDFTITSTNNTTDHSCILANTISSSFNNGSTGIRFENLDVNNTEFGIVVAGDAWCIKGCTFSYVPSTGASDTARHIGIYNISTIGWLENNVFNCTTEATPRTICMLLSAADYEFAPATKSGGYAGDLVVKGNTQGTGNLRQWLVMEVFKANGINSDPMAEHGFSMWLVNNSHNNTSGGSVILFEGAGTKAPLSFFDIIYMSGNNVGESTGTDKGFIAVDGFGALRSAGTPTHVYVDAANSGSAITTALGGTYVQGCTDDNGTGLSPVQGNAIAINSTFFSSPSPSSRLSLEATTAGGVLVPSGLAAVDGFSISAGDRVLVIDAATPTQSGIYITAAGDWSRAADMATGDSVAAAFVFVQSGSTYADTCWLCTNDTGTDTVGTDSLVFVSFGAGAEYLAGSGLALASNTFSIATGGVVESMLADASITQAKLNLSSPSSPNDAATKQYVDDAIGGTSVSVARTYYVTSTGSDVTGTGAITAPFASLQAAHDKALLDFPLAGINTANVEIAVASGVYTGNLSISRQNTHFVAYPMNPALKAVELIGNVSIDCSTAAFVFEEVVSLKGFLVNPPSASTAASVLISGTGIFTTVLDNCYINSSSTNANAHAIHCTNTAATRPIIRITQCVVHAERSANSALKAERGDWRVSLSEFDSQATPSVGTTSCISVENNATLAGGYSLFESANNAAVISMSGTMPGSSKVSLGYATIVNTCTIAASNGISVASSGLALLCSNSFFSIVEASASTFAITGVAGASLAIPICTYAVNSNIGGSATLVALRGDIAGGDLTGRFPIPTIRSGAITTAKLATGAVTATILGTGAVTTTKIADANVTQAKLSLSTPTNATDAATKQYVDNLVSGLSWKEPVKLVATAPITLSGSQSIDGLSTADGDRVLVTAQSIGAENGIYIAGSAAWSRAADLPTGDSAQGIACLATQGDDYADTQWLCTSDAPNDIVGTNSLAFTQFGIGSAYTAGDGLQLIGSAFSVLTNGDSVDATAAGIEAATLSNSTQDVTIVSATAGDGSATGLVLSTTPRGNGVVHVFINGIRVAVGDGSLVKDCYFSNDGGNTALTYADLVAGDELYWNGIIAGYELDTTDAISFLYQDIV